MQGVSVSLCRGACRPAWQTWWPASCCRTCAAFRCMTAVRRPYTVSAIANCKRAAALGYIALDAAGKARAPIAGSVAESPGSAFDER